MPSSDPVDAAWACARYEQIRARLPSAAFPPDTRRIDDLSTLVDHIDVFVLDGFGVLNIGERAVPGAPQRIAQLRAAGKRVIVLTNSATYPTATIVKNYTRLGFDFSSDEIVSSRDVLIEALGRYPREMRWGVAATAQSGIGEIAERVDLLADDPTPYAAADGFILLSSAQWTGARQERLIQALRARPRPVLVGNPDLVAPRETGLSLEPGYFAHDIADRTDCRPRFFGKPFADAFRMVEHRLGAVHQPDRIALERIAMVGDSLHTDILCAAAMGWRAVLVLEHGLLKDLPVKPLIQQTAIRPHFVSRTT